VLTQDELFYWNLAHTHTHTHTHTHRCDSQLELRMWRTFGRMYYKRSHMYKKAANCLYTCTRKFVVTVIGDHKELLLERAVERQFL